MGDRAVITGPDGKFGVYVHWNGDRDSVVGFCEACKELGYRDPVEDPTYAMAHLAMVIGVFFCEDELNVGAGPIENLNGRRRWTAGRDWEILETGKSGDRRKSDAVRDFIVRIVKTIRNLGGPGALGSLGSLGIPGGPGCPGAIAFTKARVQPGQAQTNSSVQ